MSCLTPRLTAEQIKALLEVLPRCSDCRKRGELIVNHRLLCVEHAGERRGGCVESPLWADAADVLAEALLAR